MEADQRVPSLTASLTSIYLLWLNSTTLCLLPVTLHCLHPAAGISCMSPSLKYWDGVGDKVLQEDGQVAILAPASMYMIFIGSRTHPLQKTMLTS